MTYLRTQVAKMILSALHVPQMTSSRKQVHKVGNGNSVMPWRHLGNIMLVSIFSSACQNTSE